MSGHTPGPWSVGCVALCNVPVRGWISTVIVSTPEGTTYPAEAYGATPEESEANASLIAAAPDLLEALGAFVNTLTDPEEKAALAAADADFCQPLSVLVHRAQAAIAKAEGR